MSKPKLITKSFKYRKSTGTWKLGDTTTHDSMCLKTKRDKVVDPDPAVPVIKPDSAISLDLGMYCAGIQ